jgi:hypothetical protein
MVRLSSPLAAWHACAATWNIQEETPSTEGVKRLAHKYNRKVVSLAVLADDDPNWRPDHYEEDL